MQPRKYLIGHDSYERHNMVAKLVSKESQSILDVGGSEELLSHFTGKPVATVNLESGDIQASGIHLPFPASTFDTVTSLDVLEHIPPGQRCPFVKELLRVSRKQVIVCAPYGSIQHMDSERHLLETIQRQGITNRMLAEHVANGLPTLETYTACIPREIAIQAWFSGNYKYNLFCFRIDHLFGDERYKCIKGTIGLVLNLLGNVIVFPLSLSRNPRTNTNRMFVQMQLS